MDKTKDNLLKFYLTTKVIIKIPVMIEFSVIKAAVH